MKSAARLMGGEHEPDPCLEGLPAEWADCRTEVESELMARLRARMDLGVPTVDFTYSYCLDLIYEIDREASIVWLVRNPVDCVASFMATGAWDVNDGYGKWKLHPHHQWCVGDDYWGEGSSRLGKAIWYWSTVNYLILSTTFYPREIWLNGGRPDGEEEWPETWPGLREDEEREINYSCELDYEDLVILANHGDRPLFERYCRGR